MLNLTNDQKKAYKARGIILTRDGEHFIERVLSPNGVFTGDQMQAITDAAKKYGSGKVAMTTRLTMEIMDVPFENIEACCDAMYAAGLYVGGTSSLVRPIVACKGSYCVHGLMDVHPFAERVFNEYYVKWHTVRLPHKFKIGIGGCPNNCVKPAFHDLGIMGQSVPDYDPDLCNACNKCSVIGKCPVKAAYQGEDGTLVIDAEKCTNCGKCIGACNFDSIEEKARGYKITIGGIWARLSAWALPYPVSTPRTRSWRSSRRRFSSIVSRALPASVSAVPSSVSASTTSSPRCFPTTFSSASRLSWTQSSTLSAAQPADISDFHLHIITGQMILPRRLQTKYP